MNEQEFRDSLTDLGLSLNKETKIAVVKAIDKGFRDTIKFYIDRPDGIFIRVGYLNNDGTYELCKLENIQCYYFTEMGWRASRTDDMAIEFWNKQVNIKSLMNKL
jgi:hypothetical protein